MNRIDHAAQTVLITGASSGIGEAFARALAALGSDVVLVARREGRLNRLKDELERDHGITATVIVQDVGTASVGADLRAAVDRAGVEVTSVINNAGFGTFGDFITEDSARLSQEIAVDVTAPVQVSRAFLPDLLAAGRGYLINVASMASYAPTPRMAVYGAAKSFVLDFTTALWAELRGTGIVAFALSPGATATEFNGVVGTEDATAGAAMRTPEGVVMTALAHLDKRSPGPTAIDGSANRLSALLLRLLSRRTTASLMHRVTDPARRQVSRGAASHA